MVFFVMRVDSERRRRYFLTTKDSPERKLPELSCADYIEESLLRDGAHKVNNCVLEFMFHVGRDRVGSTMIDISTGSASNIFIASWMLKGCYSGGLIDKSS